MTPAPDGGIPLPGDPIDSARWRTLVALGRSDATLLADLRDTFSQQGPELARRVLAGVGADGDFSAVRAAAHRLRGMAANLGASRLACLAAEAEEAAVAGDRERAVRAASTLPDEVARAARALDARLETTS